MDNIRVYGPYLRKDGRRHLVIKDRTTGRVTSKSYAKHLLEQKLGRELLPHESADHIDNDPSNDDPDNLQLLTRKENRDKQIVNSPAPTTIFECSICGIHFRLLDRLYRRNQIQLRKAGPFCSKKCAGIYGTDVQNNRV